MPIYTVPKEVAPMPAIPRTGGADHDLSAAMVRIDFANPGSGIIEIGTGSFTRSATPSQQFGEQPIRWQAIPIPNVSSGKATFTQWSFRASKQHSWEVVRSEVSDATSRRVEPLEIMGIFNFV